MTSSSLIPALFLAAIAVAVIAILLSALVRGIPWSGSMQRVFSRSSVMLSPLKMLENYRANNVSKVIEGYFKAFTDALSAEDFVRAEPSLKRAIDKACAVSGPSSDTIANHLLSALSSILSLADKHQIHLENLSLIEELIQDRSALLRGMAEAERSRLALKKRRDAGGKAVPQWAVVELKKQFESLNDQLQTNRLSLLSQFGEAFESVIRARSRISLTVH